MASDTKPTLYNQIGGKETIQKAVDLFYKKVLLDARISHFFDSTDMRRLYAHQARLFSLILGGLTEYKGRDLGEVHRELVEQHGLNEQHFNIFSEHLLAALVDLGVDPDIRQKIMKIVNISLIVPLNFLIALLV